MKYYIYKTIILNNLYGVDIMHEAVEIAKLRLFLKMEGAVDINLRNPNYDLEPLPDIDFNIRAGNTLVGFATEKELENAIQQDLDFKGNTLEKFKEECQIVATVFKNFQDAQLITDKGEDSHRKAKAELQKRLDNLNGKLNAYLASTYGIAKETSPNEKAFKKKYNQWLESHQPFHWFAEFYEIINGNDGFDVVIGNPPYVEYTVVKRNYEIKNYKTLSCGNIYTNIIERCHYILKASSKIAMIVQLPIVCTDRMIPIQDFISENYGAQWFATFDDRPGKLFEGLEHIRATIFIIEKKKIIAPFVFTTFYSRWYSETR